MKMRIMWLGLFQKESICMNSGRVQQPAKLHKLTALSLALLTITILAACGTTKEPIAISRAAIVSTTTAIAEETPFSEQPTVETTNVPLSVVPATTVAPTWTAVLFPGDATKQALETALAVRRNEQRTRVALTAKPTRTHGPPPVYPTYTPLMGMLSGEPNFNKDPRNPKILNGWRGVFGDKIYEIKAGSEGKAGDASQGLIVVTIWYNGKQTYNTPSKVGGVRITQVDGTRFTLTSEDGKHTFVFDVATRQWVSPQPSPVPSLSPLATTFVTPIPSLSPMATPSLPPVPSTSLPSVP